jgi:large subunit ribosomal protein L23
MAEEILKEETKKPAKKAAAKKTTTKKADGETSVKKTTTKKATSTKTATKKTAAKKVEAEKVEEVKAEVVKPAKAEKKVELPTFKYRKPCIKDYEILLGNVVTEKSQNLSITNNTLVLKVANRATAKEVKAAVQAVFGVKVDKVNIVKVLPRAKRVTRFPGHIPGYKKAYVKVNKEFNLGEIAKATSSENA